MRTVFMLMMLSICPALSLAEPVPIEVNVTPAASRPTEALHVTLTNRAVTSLRVPRNALPWSQRYSMILLGVHEEQPNRQIVQAYSLPDDIDGFVDIAPGATVSGDVQLSDFFANFTGEVQKGALLVLWSYRLETDDGRSSKRLTGQLRFAQANPK